MKRRPDISPKTGSKNALSLAICLGCVAGAVTSGFGQAKPNPTSIEEKTKIHRLATTNRAVYDAFVYLNRIPEKAEDDEKVEKLEKELKTKNCVLDSSEVSLGDLLTVRPEEASARSPTFRAPC